MRVRRYYFRRPLRLQLSMTQVQNVHVSKHVFALCFFVVLKRFKVFFGGHDHASLLIGCRGVGKGGDNGTSSPRKFPM